MEERDLESVDESTVEDDSGSLVQQQQEDESNKEDDDDQISLVDLVERNRDVVDANNDNDYDDDFSFETDSCSSIDSAEARERAIRDGFFSFLVGYVSNTVFQKILEWFQSLLRKLKGNDADADEDVGDAGEEIAQDVFEAIDPGFNPMGGGGSGGGGAAPGPPPGVAEMASAAVSVLCGCLFYRQLKACCN